MKTATSAIRIARSQVGYREGRSGGRWNNDQKYSDQLPGFAWSDNQPWCATFVQWCYWQTGVKVPSSARSASCLTSSNAYKNAGRFSEYPVIGAQVFFGENGKTHTGIVRDYDNTYVYTVEGNTNDDGSAEGDGVYLKKHRRRSAWVHGYGIPYLKGTLQSPDPRWNGKDGGGD